MVKDDLPFIRLDWLLSDAQDLRNLPPMQELPREAFVLPSEMDYAHFISHRWLSRDHPDVTGRQLAVALPAIWNHEDHQKATGEKGRTKVTGVWYDYLCLPQHPRTSAEEKAFRKQLLEFPYLTLTAIPILVVDSDMDYASRAWCVTELLGAHRSGFRAKSVSLALHVLSHPQVLCEGVSAHDASVKLNHGFKSGLTKLQRWLKRSDLTPDEAGRQAATDMEKHKQCIGAANEVYFDVCEAKLQGSRLTNDNLLAIAERRKLRCTTDSDLLICVRMLSQLLRAF